MIEPRTKCAWSIITLAVEPYISPDIALNACCAPAAVCPMTASYSGFPAPSFCTALATLHWLLLVATEQNCTPLPLDVSVNTTSLPSPPS